MVDIHPRRIVGSSRVVFNAAELQNSYTSTNRARTSRIVSHRIELAPSRSSMRHVMWIRWLSARRWRRHFSLARQQHTHTRLTVGKRTLNVGGVCSSLRARSFGIHPYFGRVKYIQPRYMPSPTNVHKLLYIVELWVVLYYYGCAASCLPNCVAYYV